MTAPLYHFEKGLIEEQRAACEVGKHELDVLKAQLEDLKKSYVKAKNKVPASEAKSTTRTAAEIRSEMEELVRQISETPEPSLPTLITGDVTEEKLVKLAAENEGVISNFSAEGELFANASGRYSSGVCTFDALLKGYPGDPIRQQRMGRPDQYIDEPRFTVAASVQPIVIKQLARKPEFRHKGFLGRLLYAAPLSPLGHRKVNADPVPDHVRSRYWNGVLQLLSDNWKNQGARTLKLSPEANCLLVQFEEWLEPKLGSDGELSPIVDWAAKLAGGIVRIAGLLHLADHVGDAEKPLVVDAETMSRALSLGDFLINHAKIAYQVMDAADDIEIEKAKRVLRWATDNGLKTFQQRDCHRSMQSIFRNNDEVKETLALLLRHEYIREASIDNSGPGRKKSKSFEINPLMRNEQN